jgi:hypothetical protein
MMDRIIPLRTYRLSRKRHCIQLSAGIARVSLPQYFGRATWDVRIDAIGVTDLSGVGESKGWADANLRSVPRVPYLFTTGPMTSPNLMLLFRTPQRLPPVRRIVAVAPNVDLPFRYREARSGALVDGVLFRAVDAQSATATLIEGGAELVDDAASWLGQHREVVKDDRAAAALRSRRKALARLGLVSAVMISAAFLAGIPLRGRGDFPVWGWLVLAVLVGGLALNVVIRRGNRE